MNLKEC